MFDLCLNYRKFQTLIGLIYTLLYYVGQPLTLITDLYLFNKV